MGTKLLAGFSAVALTLAPSLHVAAQDVLPTNLIKPVSAGGTMSFGSAVRLASFSAVSSMSGTGPTVSGANTVGVCTVVEDNSVTITGVTWGAGNNMTVVPSSSLSLSTFRASAWTIASPASAATITVTASGSWSNGAFASCSSYANANTGTPVDTASTASTLSSCSTWNNALTTGHPNEFVIDLAVDGVSVSPAPVSPSVLDESGTNPSIGFASSHQGLVSSAGSVAMDYTIGGSPSTCGWVGVALHQ